MFENIKLFFDLSPEELKTLKMFCQKRNYNQWEIIFSKWDDANAMYVLKKWLLQVESDKKILWYIKPWDIFWEMWIFNQQKIRTATIKVIENSEIIVILDFSINKLWNDHPEILNKIKNIIDKRNQLNKLLD